MAHAVRLFAGPILSMRAFSQASRYARTYALRPQANVVVVPLSDDLQDDLHGIVGTGDWLERGPRISTGDMAFAAKASRLAGVAYLETEYFGGVGEQSAVLWKGGVLGVGPLTYSMDATAKGGGRPRSLWPINVVLRGLGVVASGFIDEFEAFGLGDYRSVDDIERRALQAGP